MKAQLIPLSLLALIGNAAAQQTFDFTGDANNTSWNDPMNWEVGGGTTTNFPKDGASVDATDVTRGVATLSEDIRLTNMTLAPSVEFLIASGGNNLTLDGSLITTPGGTSAFSGGGKLIPNNMFASTFRMIGSTLEINGEKTATFTGGGLSLLDDAVAQINGEVFLTGNNTTISGGTITGSGKLTKSAGIGSSPIGSTVLTKLAEIKSSSGTLELASTTVLPTKLTAETSGLVRVTGPSVLAGSTDLSTTSGGMIIFSDEQPSFSGTVTTSGGGDTAFTISTRSGFHGGTLQASVARPFVFENGRQTSDPGSPSRNEGSFRWTGGVITDLVNDGTFSTASGGFSAPVIDGTLRNTAPRDIIVSGGITFGGGAADAPKTSRLVNPTGAFIRTTSSTAIGTQAHTDGIIENSGFIFSLNGNLDLGGCRLIHEEGDVFSENGTLRIGPGSEISATLSTGKANSEVNVRGVSSTASLPSGKTATELFSFNSEMAPLSRIVFESGNFSMLGRLTTTRRSGDASSAPRLIFDSTFTRIPASSAAEFAGAADAPIHLGATTSEVDRARFVADVDSKNTGHLIINESRWSGSGQLINEGTIELPGTFSIGAPATATNESTTGALRNTGTFTVGSVSRAGLVRMESSGSIINAAGGQWRFVQGGRINGSERTFQNEGTVTMASTGNVNARINSKFENTSSSAKIETTGGTGRITFTGETDLLQGAIDSKSSITFTGDTTLGDELTIEIAEDASVRTSPGSGKVASINGTLNISGEGAFRHTTGNLELQPGARINASGDTEFRLEGGIITGDSAGTAKLVTDGNFIFINGLIEPDVENHGQMKADGGEITSAAVTNFGTMTLAGSTMTGTELINKGDTIVETNSSITDGMLVNEAALHIDSSLTLRGASLILPASSTVTLNEGSISGTTGSSINAAAGSSIAFQSDNPARQMSISASAISLGGDISALGHTDMSIQTPSMDHTDCKFDIGADAEVSIRSGSYRMGGYRSLQVEGTFAQENLTSSDYYMPSYIVGGSGTIRANVETTKISGGLSFLDDDLTLNEGDTPQLTQTNLSERTDLELDIVGRLRLLPGAVTTAYISATRSTLLDVSSTAEINGMLKILVDAENPPADGQTFTLIETSGMTGQFSQVLLMGAPAGATATTDVVNGDLQLTYNAPSDTYDSWLANHFTETERNDPLISGPYVDADLDGIDNILEFITGSDPRAVSPPLNMTFRLEELDQAGNLTIPVVDLPIAAGRGGYYFTLTKKRSLRGVVTDLSIATQLTIGATTATIRGATAITDDIELYQLNAFLNESNTMER